MCPLACLTREPVPEPNRRSSAQIAERSVNVWSSSSSLAREIFRYFTVRLIHRNSSVLWWQLMPHPLAMAAAAHLHLPRHPFDLLSSKDVVRCDSGVYRPRPRFYRNPVTYDGISLFGTGLFRRRGVQLFPCHSFRSDNRGEETSSSELPSEDRDSRMLVVEDEKGSRKLKRKGALYALKSMIVKLSGSDSRPVGQYRKFVEKVEEVFFSVSSSLIPFPSPLFSLN